MGHRPEQSHKHRETENTWRMEQLRPHQTGSRRPRHICKLIKMEELRQSIKKMENSKLPGPDGIPIEFFKQMDEECLGILLEIFNDRWIKEIIPGETELTELATLYKKGDVEDPVYCRPIALLNTIYKIYASIIQNRIAVGLDDTLWEIQFGFRTSPALHSFYS